MSFVDNMEKKVFFKIIRWFAFFVSLIGFLAIIAGIFLFVQNFKNIFPSSEVKVEFRDVQSAIEANQSSNAEQNNNAAKATLKNAYTAAQAFFSDQPTGVATLEILKSYGLQVDNNIVVSLSAGDINGLQITTWHSNGDKSYSINAQGSISESAPGAAPPPGQKAAPKKPEEVKDNKMDVLVNEVVNQFPKGTVEPGKIKETIRNITLGIKEEYRIQYLTSLKEIIGQAPTDSKIDYANQFTTIFKQKIADVESNKEIKQMIAFKNFAIYAGTILWGILIIALFGLILVLLAIERNTRKNEEIIPPALHQDSIQ